MTKSEELLIEFRATRTVLKSTSEKYTQLKRDICKAYGKEYDAFMTDADIMEMLLSGEPKEGA
jgi:hypothetical protein